MGYSTNCTISSNVNHFGDSQHPRMCLAGGHTVNVGMRIVLLTKSYKRYFC